MRAPARRFANALIALLVIAGAGMRGVEAASTPVATNTATLIAAGDIAICGNDGARETAALIAQIPGTVAPLGDNAYELGTPQQYAQCYGSTWGRFKDRTRPAPGNHDYYFPGA